MIDNDFATLLKAPDGAFIAYTFNTQKDADKLRVKIYSRLKKDKETRIKIQRVKTKNNWNIILTKESGNV